MNKDDEFSDDMDVEAVQSENDALDRMMNVGSEP